MNCFEKFVIFVKLKGFRGRSPPPPFVFIMMFAKKGDGRNVGRGGGKWVNLILFVSFPPSPTQSTFVSWPFKLICMTEKKFPICNNNFLRKIYLF